MGVCSMALKRKFRGYSRKESLAGRAFKKERDSLTLIDMVKFGDIKGLKRLLSKGDINLEETNDTGETALILAAILGDMEALQLLIESGADVNAVSTLNTTALMAAAQNGDIKALRYLLARGADPNAKKKDDTTILMLAAMFGHAACIEALLEAGACVTAQDIYGYTALMLAGSKESIALLSTAESKELLGKNGVAGHHGKSHRKKLRKALSKAGKKKPRSLSRDEKRTREKPVFLPAH